MENSNVKAKYVYWCDEVIDEDKKVIPKKNTDTDF